MKKVNFVTTLSPHKQYAIRRWFLVTFFVVVCSVIVSAYFVLPQLLTSVALHQEVNGLRAATQEYNARVKEKDALKTEHDQIRSRTKKIENYHNAPKNPHQYIAAVVQACGDSVTLETIKFNKKECELTLLCPTSEHATVFIKRLSASDLFTNVKLVSLQQDAQTKQLRCTIKSKIID
jgi:Tfp pilus assembly protein PilN